MNHFNNVLEQEATYTRQLPYLAKYNVRPLYSLYEDYTRTVSVTSIQGNAFVYGYYCEYPNCFFTNTIPSYYPINTNDNSLLIIPASETVSYLVKCESIDRSDCVYKITFGLVREAEWAEERYTTINKNLYYDIFGTFARMTYRKDDDSKVVISTSSLAGSCYLNFVNEEKYSRMRTVRGKVIYEFDELKSPLMYYVNNSENNTMACGVKYEQGSKVRMLKSGIDNIESVSKKEGNVKYS